MKAAINYLINSIVWPTGWLEGQGLFWRPDAGDSGPAVGAFAALDRVMGDIEPVSLDEQLPALFAAGVVALVPGDVADVDVVQPLLLRYPQGQLQGRHRRGLLVRRLVVRKEAAEVSGDVGPELVRLPAAKFP